MRRRDFIQKSLAAGAGVSAISILGQGCSNPSAMSKEPFKLSLAQWSLHRAFFNEGLDPLDFAKITREEFDIGGIEYVNQFFADKAQDEAYLKELKMRADDNGVKSLLIMVDREGQLGNPDTAARTQAVENHYKWVDAAAYLGCHSIRVNAGGQGTREEQMKNAADGLAKLSGYAQKIGLNVLVENHGGLSSDGAWLAGVMAKVGMDNCGTLPDFGNFCIERGTDENGNRICINEYDRYQGVAELMPFAIAVSAKSHDFDSDGNEIHTDFEQMMKIVLDAGYNGYVGIEYEGRKISEMEGIRLTRDLLLRIRESVA